MENIDSELSSILERYELTEHDCEKIVSDCHVEDISRSHCEKWRMLPSHLRLESIIVNDAEREATTEEERRLVFFRRWKRERGSDANYKSLIRALLLMKYRGDAESVCKLLKNSTLRQQLFKADTGMLHI